MNKNNKGDRSENNFNQIDISDINVEDPENGVVITTQDELTSILKSDKNGESVDTKYKNCMRKSGSMPRVNLCCCFSYGLIAKEAIKNIDDIFQYLGSYLSSKHM